MRDMNCPYCGAGVAVCHDDGAGYSEERAHERQCSECEKNFVFYTHISFSYSPQKAECLNDGRHMLKLSSTYPREFSRMQCQTCDYDRAATAEELARATSTGEPS